MSGSSRIAFVALLLLFGACSGSGDSFDPELTIVATNTILGDFVANVAGADAAVVVLTPVGADPHDFRPSASQVADINGADLVVANGLGLEEGIEDVLEAAEEDGVRIVRISDDADSVDELDPHIWLDPVLMAAATDMIARELAAINGSVDWMSRAERYSDQLLALDDEIRDLLSVIPEGERKLVTNHDSLSYFADRYELEVIGTVIPGRSTLGNPSSAELASLVDLMRGTGSTAIFAETTQPTALAEAIAAELGTDVEVVSLYTGSVGEPGSGAETLVGMLRINASRIAGALSP
ncbi:MAG: zinc ABC transporter substrate-binding protein [Acidimicrobiia bacterium]|nr:zinc ABC transporter substrate-binding protein [Acidimicrobiia bacterium]